MPRALAAALHAGHLGGAGLDWVPLLAPTSTPARIARAAEVADGFVYYVSMTGVTGAALAPALAEAESKVAELRKVLKQPIAVGFGVATPEDARLVGGAPASWSAARCPSMWPSGCSAATWWRPRLARV